MSRLLDRTVRQRKPLLATLTKAIGNWLDELVAHTPVQPPLKPFGEGQGRKQTPSAIAARAARERRINETDETKLDPSRCRCLACWILPPDEWYRLIPGGEGSVWQVFDECPYCHETVEKMQGRFDAACYYDYGIKHYKGRAVPNKYSPWKSAV